MKISSPGRFYSAVATKLIMAHVLKTFDCSLKNGHMKTATIWRSYVLPRDDVLVQFSPRISTD